jgi:hypothetical protein
LKLNDNFHPFIPKQKKEVGRDRQTSIRLLKKSSMTFSTPSWQKRGFAN